MKPHPLKRILATSGALIGMALAGSAHASTTLHSDGFTADNLPLPNAPNYGSNVAAGGSNWNVMAGASGVTGTPGIQLIWDGQGGGNNGDGLDTYTAWDGRGNVVQIDGGSPGGTPFTYIHFVPSSGQIGVVVASFDLDAWAGGGDMAVDWAIHDSTPTGTTLAGGTWTKSDAGGRDTLAPNLTGALGQTLVLSFEQTSGDPTFLAMDNLTFDQIPEPSAILMGGLALGIAAIRRRRG